MSIYGLIKNIGNQVYTRAAAATTAAANAITTNAAAITRIGVNALANGVGTLDDYRKTFAGVIAPEYPEALRRITHLQNENNRLVNENNLLRGENYLLRRANNILRGVNTKLLVHNSLLQIVAVSFCYIAAVAIINASAPVIISPSIKYLG